MVSPLNSLLFLLKQNHFSAFANTCQRQIAKAQEVKKDTLTEFGWFSFFPPLVN